MVGWFLAPYVRDRSRPRPTRYCVVREHSDAIRSDAGSWSHAEVLGNVAIVKVQASPATLAAIAARPGVTRLPLTLLADPLSSLTVAQRTAIRQRLEGLGYPLQEIRDRLGDDLGARTLGDVLRFAASRRRKPRYDRAVDAIVLDGPTQPCAPIERVDRAVRG